MKRQLLPFLVWGVMLYVLNILLKRPIRSTSRKSTTRKSMKRKRKSMRGGSDSNNDYSLPIYLTDGSYKMTWEDREVGKCYLKAQELRNIII